MKKDIIKFIVKVLLYALGLVASYLGVTSLTSCTASRSVDSVGKARIVLVDTTVVNHNGFINFKYK